MNEKVRMGVSVLVASGAVGGSLGLANVCSSERKVVERAEAVCDEVSQVLADEYGVSEKEKIVNRLEEVELNKRVLNQRKVNERVKSGMVYLSTDCKKSFCTGFIYDDHTIVSCEHCLDEGVLLNNSLCIHFVGGMKDGGQRVPEWTLIDEKKFVTAEVKDYRVNLAVFHPDSPYFTTDKQFDDVGIMSVKEKLSEISGGVAVALPIRDGKEGLDFVKVILSSRRKRGYEGPGFRKLRDLTFEYDFSRGLRFDNFPVPGDSGTPVTDGDGNVVGLVCYEKLPSWSAGNPILTSSKIDYLKENGGLDCGAVKTIDIEIQK